jgi:nucleobase:cation symporter-1, NCS1 family
MDILQAMIIILTIFSGGFSTLAVNIPDFSRFAKKPGHQVWQLPFIPLFMIIISILGIVSASATKSLYGKVLWQPLDIVGTWQTSPGGRAAAFFCAALWCLAQICVNISANAISFGNGIYLLQSLSSMKLTLTSRYYISQSKILQH